MDFQVERIAVYKESLDINSSCFVFASAGSGKTKILVDRFIKSLICGVEPSEILCLTFTNAAVFEMQTRISTILEKLYINENDFTKKYLQEIFCEKNINSFHINNAKNLFFKFQDNLSNLKILTIHGFCQRILKKFPFEAEVSPQFEILDDYDMSELFEQAKLNIFKKICENKHLINDALGLFKQISAYTFDEMITQANSESLNFQNFFEENKEIEPYEIKLKNVFNIKQNEMFGYAEQDVINNFFHNKNIESEFLTKTGEVRKRLPKINCDPEILKQIAEKIYQNSQNQKKIKTLSKTISFLKIIKMFFQELDILKETSINFSDVLIKTKYLLTKSHFKDFVLFDICKKIKNIMIDEAQDLSDLQWELISLFADGILNNPDDNFRKTIFVVGDIKQSIYRFQGANCKLFTEFYEYCKQKLENLNKTIKLLNLNTCYRTRPEILENIDQIFNKVSKFAFENQSYKDHVPFKTDSPGTFKNFDEDNIEETLKLISSFESQDVLILTRSRSSQSDVLVKNLKEKNIKIATSDRLFLLENFMIMDLLAISKISTNFDDDYSLACILKSEYIFETPLSEQELYDLCSNRLKSLYNQIKEKYPEKFNVISQLISFYTEENPFEYFYKLSNALVRKNDYILSSFLDQVLKFDLKNMFTTSEFCKKFRKTDFYVSNKSTNYNCIRISTIHGAKGLEAQNVLILNFNLKPDRQKLKFIWQRNDNLFQNHLTDNQVFFIKPSKKNSFPEADLFIDCELVQEEKELWRLLYVAMTRAKDTLYISSNLIETIKNFTINTSD